MLNWEEYLSIASSDQIVVDLDVFAAMQCGDCCHIDLAPLDDFHASTWSSILI